MASPVVCGAWRSRSLLASIDHAPSGPQGPPCPLCVRGDFVSRRLRPNRPAAAAGPRQNRGRTAADTSPPLHAFAPSSRLHRAFIALSFASSIAVGDCLGRVPRHRARHRRRGVDLCLLRPRLRMRRRVARTHGRGARAHAHGRPRRCERAPVATCGGTTERPRARGDAAGYHDGTLRRARDARDARDAARVAAAGQAARGHALPSGRAGGRHGEVAVRGPLSHRIRLDPAFVARVDPVVVRASGPAGASCRAQAAGSKRHEATWYAAACVGHWGLVQRDLIHAGRSFSGRRTVTA